MTRKCKDDLELTIRCVEEDGEPVIYILHKGTRIAKRGKPGTPHYKQWIPLQLAGSSATTTILKESRSLSSQGWGRRDEQKAPVD